MMGRALFMQLKSVNGQVVQKFQKKVQVKAQVPT